MKRSASKPMKTLKTPWERTKKHLEDIGFRPLAWTQNNNDQRDNWFRILVLDKEDQQLSVVGAGATGYGGGIDHTPDPQTVVGTWVDLAIVDILDLRIGFNPFLPKRDPELGLTFLTGSDWDNLKTGRESLGLVLSALLKLEGAKEAMEKLREENFAK